MLTWGVCVCARARLCVCVCVCVRACVCVKFYIVDYCAEARYGSRMCVCQQRWTTSIQKSHRPGCFRFWSYSNLGLENHGHHPIGVTGQERPADTHGREQNRHHRECLQDFSYGGGRRQVHKYDNDERVHWINKTNNNITTRRLRTCTRTHRCWPATRILVLCSERDGRAFTSISKQWVVCLPSWSMTERNYHLI